MTEHGDVGAIERVEAAQHGVRFETRLGRARLRMPAVSMKRMRPALGLHDGVDGVARRAGHVVHDRALLADELIEQRRLADVGSPHDRDAQRAVVVIVATSSISISSPSSSTMRSSRSPGPRPCWRAHRERIAHAELRGTPSCAPRVVGRRPC